MVETNNQDRVGIDEGKTVGVRVHTEWSELTLRYDIERTFSEMYKNLHHIIAGLGAGHVLDQESAALVASQIAGRALMIYSEKAVVQLDATQQSMMTKAMATAFDEWRDNLYLLATPKSVKVVGKEMRKLRRRVNEDEERYVWGKRASGRPPQSEAEKRALIAVETERTVARLVEIVCSLRRNGERHVIRADVARKMFPHLNDFTDMRSSYSRLLRNCGVKHEDVLKLADEKVLTEN